MSSEDQEIVNMVEVLEEEQKLEEDANAVLGGSDSVHCTYPKGYLARQALYSCATCTGADDPPAGVCLACSLECHEGHDLYELYTKRNFACDCGNSKFKNRECKLCPEKSAINEKNLYNQNFRGIYCTCHRPYPDPEDEVEDGMIQCVICEDWYHGRHLKAEVPEDSNYEEMICFLCMEKHPFLKFYQHLQVNNGRSHHMKMGKEDEDSVVKVDVGSPEKISATEVTDTPKNIQNSDSANSKSQPESTTDHGNSENSELQKSPVKLETTAQTSKIESETQSTVRNEDDIKSDILPGTSDECQLTRLKRDLCEQQSKEHSTFWKQNWRTSLCLCAECKDMYKKENISFITDISDTITMYEARGRLAQGSSSTQYERGLEALSQMNRVQQVEVIHGFNDLKTELKDYLKKFAENGKVVKEEDIKEFFTGLASRKKQKVEMPYYCK